MTRHLFWAALVVAGGVVVGCGPAKELPDEWAKSPDPGEKVVPVPAASEPAAKEYIEKAVKAYTSGKPELVAKGTASRVTLAGMRLHPVENERVPVSTTRTIAAVWSDRFYFRDELHIRGNKVAFEVWLHGSSVAVAAAGKEDILPNRAEAQQLLDADVTAQHWMALMLPLTHPKAVVFGFQRQTVHQVPVQMVKLSLNALPVYQLYFDAKTDALLRVDYVVVENGARRHRQWTAADHKLGPDGLLLPGKTECRHDNVIVEEWTAEKWEFPATIDSKEFSPPKK